MNLMPSTFLKSKLMKDMPFFGRNPRSSGLLQHFEPQYFNTFTRLKNLLLMLALALTFTNALSQVKPTAWDMFAKTKFESKYYEKLGEYLFYPNFPPDLKAMEGKEITVEGYYVPFAPEDGDYIIISKYPMSQCFFCGGGGPESIAEVNFIKTSTKFDVDDLITVKGKLKLNTDNLDHVNFILDQATLIKK
jgi:hypothetical protein